MSRNKLLFVLRLFVSLGLLAYLVYLVDWERAFRNVVNADKRFLAAAPLVVLLGIGIVSQRWRLILADNQVKFSARQAFRGYWLSLFYGNFLPTALGGDAIRIGLCVQATQCPVGISTAAVLLERASGVISLFCLLLTACLVSPNVASTLFSLADTRLVTLLTVAGIAGIGVILASRQRWGRWLSQIKVGGVWPFFLSMLLTLGALKNLTLVRVLVVSILFQLADVVTTFLVARAIGLHLSLTVFMAVLPLVYLMLMFPISLGGLGVREGALALLLARFGVLPNDALTLSFLTYLNRMFVGSLGIGAQYLCLLLAVSKSWWSNAGPVDQLE